MKKGYIYIIITAILFSSMEIALKVVATDFNPVQLTFIRFFIGALILWPIARRKLQTRNMHLKAGDIKFFMLTGFICVVVSMTFYQLSILYCQASTVAVLFSCNPVFVVPLAFFMLKEKVTKLNILSIIVSIGGMVFILNPFQLESGDTRLLGILFIIMAAITFAFYTVIGKSQSEQYGGLVATAYSFLFGSLEMLILILLSHVNIVATIFQASGLDIFAQIPLLKGISWQTLPLIIYISVFVTGLGYTSYFLAMENTSAVTASVVFFIKPALAPILALILIHESIGFNTLGGIIFILLGSSLTFIANSRNAKHQTQSLKKGA
ncbi:MAG: EamA family transporter [Peptococcaceae bacterium]|jgi:drug/metabolite transporter (DMT)-like permease|nr:EamA family transporter [Peptococcaceae bacterium]